MEPEFYGLGDAGRGQDRGSSGGGGRSSPVQFVYSDSDNDNERDGEEALRRVVHAGGGGDGGSEREREAGTESSIRADISLDISRVGSGGEGDRDHDGDEGNNATSVEATLRHLAKGRASLYTAPTSACITAYGIDTRADTDEGTGLHVDFNWGCRSQRSTLASKTNISAKALIEKEELEIEKKVNFSTLPKLPLHA